MAENPVPVRIFVGGKNVTDAFEPWLISVVVEDKADETDTCEIDLDDTNGALAMPSYGEDVQVYFRPWDGRGGWELTFQGQIADMESYFARPNGRRFAIVATGAQMVGDTKSRFTAAYGQGDEMPFGGSGGGSGAGSGGSGGSGSGSGGTTVGEAIQGSAKLAGVSCSVDPTIAAMKRPYIAQQNESFPSFVQRLCREVGGQLKIANGIASVTAIGSGTNAAGEAMASVSATWGDNLIAWKIKPIVSRPQYGGAQAPWYSKATSLWEFAQSSIPGTGEGGAFSAIGQTLMATHQNPHQSEDEATQQAGGDGATSESERGTGWLLIQGIPSAHSGGSVSLSGARPGVDGSYTIEEVAHSWSRVGGYTTRLTVKSPSGGAGVDSRSLGPAYGGNTPFGGGSDPRPGSPNYGGPR